jgi:hypothetical protein
MRLDQPGAEARRVLSTLNAALEGPLFHGAACRLDCVSAEVNPQMFCTMARRLKDHSSTARCRKAEPN